MTENTVIKEGKALLEIESQTPVLCDLPSAADLLARLLWSEEDCCGALLNRDAVDASFFDLRSGFAGEVMQKFANYRRKLAIWGDFSALTAGSKSLEALVRESNRGNHIRFAATKEEAAEWLLRGP